jgi:hypothetical protein
MQETTATYSKGDHIIVSQAVQQGATSQKTAIFIVTAMKTSNLTLNFGCSRLEFQSGINYPDSGFS